MRRVDRRLGHERQPVAQAALDRAEELLDRLVLGFSIDEGFQRLTGTLLYELSVAGFGIQGQERLEPVEQPIQAVGHGLALGMVGRHVIDLQEQVGPAPLQVVGDRRIRRPAVTDDGALEPLTEDHHDDAAATTLTDGEQPVLTGPERPEPPLLAVEFEAGFVGMDHLGLSDALANLLVLFTASVGDPFGDAPGRRCRQVEIEQLGGPVWDLPVG